MNLELKHIATYLPYGLKVLNLSMHENGFRIKHSVKKLVVTPSNLEIGLKDVDGIKEKPILRPLSDLTKEIEHNQEKFKPCEWFSDINSDIDFELQIKSLSNDIRWLNSTNYGIIQKLIEWHFDIYGLIPTGLAVSIHDVEQVIT